MVESKWFRGFDWFYRLIVINLITILIPLLLSIGPLLIWYYYNNLVFFLITGLFLAFFSFIPCFVTSFFLIKYFKEEKAGNVFVLYFKTLKIVFNSIYKYELIVVPIIFLFLYGAYYYWLMLDPEYYQLVWGYIAIIGFLVSFLCLSLFVLSLVNIPMIVSYYRMKTKDLIKLSLYMSLRYFFKTLLYFIILCVPLLLIIWNPAFFIPLYTLLGISLPLYVIYILSHKFYWYLSKNIEDVKDAEKYNLKGEENETGN